MILLDYVLRKAPEPGLDLTGVDENALHYDVFLGDVIFRINDVDMSADWGWIPIIDFAVCLDRISKGLVPGTTQSFEFTESESRIDFTLRGGTADIRATYAAQEASVAVEDFRRATTEFLRRLLDDLTTRHSSLAQNAYVRRIYPKMGTADS